MKERKEQREDQSIPFLLSDIAHLAVLEEDISNGLSFFLSVLFRDMFREFAPLSREKESFINQQEEFFFHSLKTEERKKKKE